MKKLFVILVVAMGLSMTAGAQSRAIGVRTGMLSYEMYFGDPNFVELNVGWDYTGILAAGTYNWLFAEPSWTSSGEWGIYGGPGVALGRSTDDDDHGALAFGVALQAGVEYTFASHIMLSADVRPTFGLADGKFWKKGMNGFIPSLAIRYRF